MGIGEFKRDIREKIINCQYHMPQDDIWTLLDTYDQYLKEEHTADELAEAAYLRGDAAFHMGRYHDTVKALTKSLGIEKTSEYAYLEADAYNMLGMLFSFVGYEDVALSNYLSAVDAAKRSGNVQEQVSAILNAGILYQGLKDYRKAMFYYKKAYEVANENHAIPQIMLVLLSLIQRAQLLLKMGRVEEARRIKREIDSYYQVVARGEMLLPKCILEVWLEARFGTAERVEELVEEIYQSFEQDGEYLEQIDFYVEFCSYLMENGRKEDARRFLDLLLKRLSTTEFLHIRMRVEEMEVEYQKKYCGEEEYFEACLHYMSVQQEYERMLRAFKRKNLSNIENLREIEKQREELEFRSKCDLATGLLNKDTFQYETERYLEERNRNVTDVLIIIDIDDFKLVNDRFGHLVGDEAIEKLADLMKGWFQEDLCGRFGGDEFVVFIRDAKDMEHVEEKIEKFRETFEGVGFGRNESIHGTVSIGVSYNHGISASYKSMFSCADEALLKAKEYGKNRVAFYEIKRGILKYV